MAHLTHLLAIGLVAGLGARALADDKHTGQEDVNHLRTFVNSADTNLAEAIKAAEKETNGKAVGAQIMEANEHKGSAAAGVDHYKVCCLVGDRIIEVCVDRTGKILNKAAKDDDNSDRQARMSARDNDTRTIAGSPQHAFRIQKASDLIGKPVVNPQGERLGEVQDLAIDPDHETRVAYAVLSFGGFLGMGEKWFAIPMSALTLPDDAKHFVLAVEKDRLKTAASFDKERWPKMGDLAWATDVHKFYGQRPYWVTRETESSPETPLRIQKASDLMGRSVQNDRGEKLGDIKDLAIDPDNGRVVYAVLSFGGFLGMGDKLFAIPPSVVQIPGTGSFTVLMIDKEQLKNAPGFDKSHWPNLAEPTLVTSTYEFYGQKPYRVETRTGR